MKGSWVVCHKSGCDALRNCKQIAGAKGVNSGLCGGCWQQFFLCATLSASWWLYMSHEKGSEMPPACSVGITLTLNLKGAKAGEYLLPADSELGCAMLWTRSDGAEETAGLWKVRPSSCLWKDLPLLWQWLLYNRSRNQSSGIKHTAKGVEAGTFVLMIDKRVKSGREVPQSNLG